MRLKLKHLESDDHKAFYDWAKKYHTIEPFLFHIEHGIPYSKDKKRNFMLAAFLKARGLKRGIADFHFMRPNKKHGSLYIEFKVKPNKLTPDQKRFFELAEQCNHKCVCVYSVDEAIKEIQEYLRN